MTRFSIRVPAALQEKTKPIAQATDAACCQRLSHEHRQLTCLTKGHA